VFWGAVIGHWVAGCTAITFAMIPPEAWTSGEVLRGFFGYWSLLVFPVVGAAIGAGISSHARNGRMEPILSSSWQEEIRAS
jgi:hypothetical protein